MKYSYFILLLLFAIVACKNENAANQDQPDQTEDVQSAADETPSKPKSREEQFLLKNFWVFEYYIIPNDHPKSVESRGRWYAFNEDGTFESGHWEEVTGKGTWTLFKDGSKTKVRCDAEDDTQDAEWELQFDQDGDVASWIGTSVYESNKGVMGKVINLMTRPTKKQFGYE